MRIIHDLISLYVLILFVLILLTWFPDTGEGALRTFRRILIRLTDPVLRPLRRIIPIVRFGGVGIDITALVAMVALEIINRYI